KEPQEEVGVLGFVRAQSLGSDPQGARGVRAALRGGIEGAAQRLGHLERALEAIAGVLGEGAQTDALQLARDAAIHLPRRPRLLRQDVLENLLASVGAEG